MSTPPARPRSARLRTGNVRSRQQALTPLKTGSEGCNKVEDPPASGTVRAKAERAGMAKLGFRKNAGIDRGAAPTQIIVEFWNETGCDQAASHVAIFIKSTVLETENVLHRDDV
jgi:hypothetical protein